MPKLNIRNKLLIFGMIWLTICSFGFMTFFNWNTQRDLLKSAAKRSEAFASKLVDSTESSIFSGDDDQITLEINKIISGDIVGASIQIPGYAYLSAMVKANFRDLENDIIPGSKLINVGGERIIQTTRSIRSQTGQLVKVSVLLNAEPIYEQTNETLKAAFVLLIPMLLSFWGISWILSGKLVLPLYRLANHVAVKKRKSSDLEGDSVSKNEDELEQVFNYLLEVEEDLSNKSDVVANMGQKHRTEIERKTTAFEEERLALANSLELNNKLLLLLSHETRTPMEALSLHVTNLFESLENPTKQQRHKIDRIQALTRHISNLMSSVLRFSTKGLSQLEVQTAPVDLFKVSQQVVFSLEIFSKELDVKCVIGPSIKNIFILVDPDHCEQILMNLIHNAIKQSPPGSEVLLTSEEKEGEILIKVKDSGLGIHSSLKERIFKTPLKSTSPGSNGVGLYICRYLIELHSGSIWFEENEGRAQGTSFVFSLPKSKRAIARRISLP